MTTPPIPALPMAMIVAARDVLLAHRGEVWASSITGIVHSWSCSCGEAGPVDNREEGDRLAANHIAAVTLAAAFGMCDVQPRFRVHWVAKNGDPEDDLFSGFYDTVERAQEHVAAFEDRDRRREHKAVIEQSLEIFTPVTSPAEQVDTEGAP